MRLFVAVDVSDEIVATLAETQKRLKQAGADVAWTKPENMHLTLKFLGETADARVGEIKAALDLVALRHQPFEMKVYELGSFPEQGNPRVLWAGVTAGREPLSALARDVEQSLAELGFPKEQRPFTAHLTLGRLRSPRGAGRLLKLMERVGTLEFGQCRINDLRLYKSTLVPGGSIYEVQHAARLTGA